MINRLPLDYEDLFARWNELTREISQGERMIPSAWDHSLWQSKLELMSKVITAHPDSGSCDRCGECCLDFPFACRPVEFFYLLPHMALNWSQDQQQDFFYNQMGRLKEDGSNYCPFLTPEGCSIYPVRPLLCRRAICGDHICNRLSRDFDSLGDWCNHSQVIIQLTTMNLVYYYVDKENRSVELSWDFSGRQQKSSSLTVAPFEVWLLLLLKEQELYERIINLKYFKPLLRWTG